MKLSALLIGFLFFPVMLRAQAGAACIEKSSRNIYAAGGDSTLLIYKTIRAGSKDRLLLFYVRPSNGNPAVHTVAKTVTDGVIEWTRGIIVQTPTYSVSLTDAIVLSNNQYLIFCVLQSGNLMLPWIIQATWLNENGDIIRQRSWAGKSDPDLFSSAPGTSYLSELPGGDVLFCMGVGLQATAVSAALIGRIEVSGNLSWSSQVKIADNGSGTIGFTCTENTIFLQTLSARSLYPNIFFLHSTKINTTDGTVRTGKSYQDFIDMHAGNGGSSMTMLTDGNRLKTMATWRIPAVYQVYFSFYQDTSLNLLKTGSLITSSTATSYLPVSMTMNKKGMALINVAGTNVPSNQGYIITGADDELLVQRKIANDPPFEQFTSGNSGQQIVAFDQADTAYVYWSGRRNGKNVVGWIRTNLPDTTAYCAVKDSSFIQQTTLPMAAYNWQGANHAFDVLAPASTSISLFAPLIAREIICEKITGFCEHMKLDRPGRICDITSPVRITARKNPECHGTIFFDAEETISDALANKQQLNDTTWLLWFHKSWQGKIYARSSYCPAMKDTIDLVVNAPKPAIDLGKDAVLCKGNTLQLDAGSGFETYVWQDGTTGPLYTVTKGGSYKVTAEDLCGRVYSGSIKVEYVDKTPELGPPVTICKKEALTLKAKGSFASYQWEPAYNISNQDQQSVNVFPEITTAYRVAATTSHGCVFRDTVLVTVENCPQEFYIPSAFTPNNDGLNDVIKPIVTAPLEQYVFSIYNRWGQQIFYTTDIQKAWDGRLNGVPQDSGSFTWMCTYKFYDKPAEFKKGSFVMIR